MHAQVAVWLLPPGATTNEGLPQGLAGGDGRLWGCIDVRTQFVFDENSFSPIVHLRAELDVLRVVLQKPQAVQGSWPLAPAVDKTSEKIGPQKRTAGQWEDTEDGGKHCR